MQVTIWNYLSESGFTNIDIYTNRLMWHLAFYEQHCEINNSNGICDYIFQDFSSFNEMDSVFFDFRYEYLSISYCLEYCFFSLLFTLLSLQWSQCNGLNCFAFVFFFEGLVFFGFLFLFSFLFLFFCFLYCIKLHSEYRKLKETRHFS